MQFGLLDETSDPEPYLASDEWVCEEKENGMRLQLRKSGNVVTGTTRNGLEWEVPTAVKTEALKLPFSFLVDGELIGEKFVPFDLLEMAGADFSKYPLAIRRTMLISSFGLAVRHAEDATGKRALFADVMARGGEGVVFKRSTAPYVAGREYGVKFKFYRTETFRVSSVNLAKGTCEIERGGKSCGSVVFPWEQWPNVGDLCEVRFDSVSKNGKLMRAKWLGLRKDLGEEAVAEPLTH